MAILAAAAALAVPASARDWDDYNNCNGNAYPVYTTRVVVRHDGGANRGFRRDVRPVRGGFAGERR
jgi:hypothetical protein